MKKVLLIILTLMLLSPLTRAETLLLAVDVGKGDALIVVANGYTMLIDAGYAHMAGRIRAAMDYLGIEKFDFAALTHTDNDHAGGMAYIYQSDIIVGEYIAAELYACKPKKHPYAKLGIDARFISAGEELFPGCTALAPLTLSDEENDNSLVLRVETEDGVLLLTGDMEFPEEAQLLATGANLKCDVLKVANHGDSDATGAAFVYAASPAVALISSDPYEDPDKPGADVLARLRASGASIYGTYEGGSALATLENGAARAEYLTFAPSDIPQIELTIDKSSDTVTLINASGKDIDLHDWYLYSEKGGELHVLKNATLFADQKLVIGSRSTEIDIDILWDDKKLLSKKDDERVYLYNSRGEIAAYSE